MKRSTILILMTLVVHFESVGRSVAVPECWESPADDRSIWRQWENCKGTVSRSDGFFYTGEWKSGLPNGHGTVTVGVPSPNAGFKYVGEFKDGKFNGEGIGIFVAPHKDEGQKYIGEFKDGKYYGQGTLIFDAPHSGAGQKYAGEFFDGKYHGMGIVTFVAPHKDAGQNYIGEFKFGKFNGQGTGIFYAPHRGEGFKYVGQWKNDKFHGQGALTYNVPHKRAGEKYVGEFKDNKRYGYGAVTFDTPHRSAGFKYTGEWEEGKYHGNGTITYSTPHKRAGEKYVGEFRDNKRYGKGVGTYADGTIKEGIWDNSKFKFTTNISPRTTGKNLLQAKKRSTQQSQIKEQPQELIYASSGSGFAVSTEGYVITNNHVIERCHNVKIHNKDRTVPANIVAIDQRNDLALLKGKFRPSSVFPLSNSKTELLQDIYVAGFPFGGKISTTVKVTKGIISSLSGVGNNFSHIQIDAALQPGNSGGPILNEKGNVVGVAVAKLDIKKIIKNLTVTPEGTNFGIKTGVIRRILKNNQVSIPSPNTKIISKNILGKMISEGTYYLSCWMTKAQMKQTNSRRVIFQNLE